MNKIIALVITLYATLSFAADTYVRGYHRKDGTYVKPHVRSKPDAYKWNNYGSSRSSPGYNSNTSYTNPYTRDSDRDGISNQYDTDDDNDGIHDDNE